MIKWVNIWKCPQSQTDNAHISTPGQRTCLWWDEMEWKLFHHTTWQSWRLRNSSSSALIFSPPGQYISQAPPVQLHFLIYSKLNCISPHWQDTANYCKLSWFLYTKEQNSAQSFVIQFNGIFVISSAQSLGPCWIFNLFMFGYFMTTSSWNIYHQLLPLSEPQIRHFSLLIRLMTTRANTSKYFKSFPKLNS